MDIDIEEKKRNVIPRWRDFNTTLRLGELRSSEGNTTKEITEAGNIDEQIADWQNNRTLSFATDLVGAGFVVGKTDGIDEAVNFILSDESTATELQKKIARQAKNSELITQYENLEDNIPNSEKIIDHSKKQVRIYRNDLRNSLRNPIKLVELSREHATLGHLKKALHAMDIAVALAPANRFILRSAARLYVHADEIDKATYILRRAPSLRSDPWLLAAEIAVSSKLGQTSHNIKQGIQKIDNTNYSPFELSELTSALATLEMNNANTKRARKLFKQALRQPTENSIAQAEWASRTTQNLNIEIRDYTAPLNYEALAWNHFQEGGMNPALNQGKNWIFDQPFAVSPVVFTAMVASLIEEFELGKSVLNFGLRANPENVTLRNNLAFVLATNNEPDLAETELEKIDQTSLNSQEKITVVATEGLIKFRKGLYFEGRSLYSRAIDIARNTNEFGYALRALIYLAREEVFAETGLAIKTLENAEREAKKFQPTHEMALIFSRLNSIIETKREVFLLAQQLNLKTNN